MCVTGRHASSLNNRPIIGILAQDTRSSYGSTYIPVTYVKYLQQAGARVVPIRGNQPEEYYKEMVAFTNGILLPGGAVSFATSQFARSAKFVWDMALKMNSAGDYYPIWGTCMGFQIMCNLTVGVNLLRPTDSNNASWPIDFSPDYSQSRLFKNAPTDVIEYLTTEPVTQNQHSYSILTKVFESSKLSSFFTKLSTNKDRKGTEFISTVEAKKYPFYGVQWHPEKSSFNWNPNYVINHDAHAVAVGQYMANFFVSEARKSAHHFPSVKMEATNLIQNYKKVYFSDGTFFENYYFD